MQLSAITDEISQNFEHALDVLLEYGATGAELRGLWGVNISDLSDDQVESAKSALKSRGLSAVCLATPFYKCDMAAANPPDGSSGAMHLAQPRDFEHQMEMLRRCIRLAQVFDTQLIRVFSFWRKDAYNAEIEKRIVDLFAEPVAFAAAAGIVLALENEHACYIGTGAEAARIAAAVNSPALRIVWDPGNAFFADEIPYPDGYEAVKQWLAHIHIKDGRMVQTADQGRRPEWCVVGEGEIDYAGQFAALKRDKYPGYVSLETHYVPATGSGDGGKGTPEDGSRPCLAALRKLIDA
jgi:sugar phosphate isomerase/epimerase